VAVATRGPYMSDRRRLALAIEVLVLTTLAAASAAMLPLTEGYWGWSWDGLNHHVYLGMMAESSRLGHDVIAAGYQSYQYPYLYWPVYRLSLFEGTGAVAAAIWAAAQAAVLVPPVWLISLRVLPTRQGYWIGASERLAACALAFMSTVVVAALDTTANDLLAAVPLLWAFAVLAAEPASDRRAAVASALWGVSSAFKLSNAIFLPLLLWWWWTPGRRVPSMRRGGTMALAASLGFLVAYGPWGWQLWRLTGNPLYPFLGPLFGTASGG